MKISLEKSSKRPPLGNPSKLMRTHSSTSMPSTSTLVLLAPLKNLNSIYSPFPSTKNQLTSKSKLNSIAEHNGQSSSTQSEIKLNAVHVGLSELLKPSQIDSQLPLTVQLTQSSHPNSWSLVTPETTVAMVDISDMLGNILKKREQSQMHATPTHLEPPDKQEDAQHQAPALMAQPQRFTSARLDQDSSLEMKTQLKMQSKQEDLLRPDSMSIKTSSTTRVESTLMSVEDSLVVTPLKSSVGVLIQLEVTTGYVLTHGVPSGVNKVTSESQRKTQVLELLKPTLVAHQISLLLLQWNDRS